MKRAEKTELNFAGAYSFQRLKYITSGKFTGR